MNRVVSIVLPVFNGERYLAQSVESILNQSYSNFELIVVNDCSTDRTEDIIQNFASIDSRIIYIKNEKNLKLPASLNRGFSIARGEYYTWTSDDNLYHQEAIEKMVRYLDNHPDYGMVACDYRTINAEGAVQATAHVGDSDALVIKNRVGACFMYRKHVAEEIGEYRTDLFLVEDYDYWLRIRRKYPIAFLHEPLYDYRVHEKSLTAERKQEVQSVLIEYQWNNLRINEKDSIPEDILFQFFDYVLPFKRSVFQRTFYRICFGLRHRHYFSYYHRKRKKYHIGIY